MLSRSLEHHQSFYNISFSPYSVETSFLSQETLRSGQTFLSMARDLSTYSMTASLFLLTSSSVTLSLYEMLWKSVDSVKLSLFSLLRILLDFDTRQANWFHPTDSVKPIILKEFRLEIDSVICLLFEKSLENGQIPVEWTKAQVCPFSKKGHKTDPANNRPISLTCIVCKVMEHVISSSISKYLTHHNVLFELQHCFREKPPAKHNLFNLRRIQQGSWLLENKQI